MSSLQKITAELRTTVEKAGFRALYGLWDGSCIGWAKALTPGSGVYAYIHAYKLKDGYNYANFWIAPVGNLDSSFMATSIAFGFRIGKNWNEDDEFFRRCAKKIENMLPHVYSLEKAVLNELAAPSNISHDNNMSMNRDEKYLAELALLNVSIISDQFDEYREIIRNSWNKKEKKFKLPIPDEQIEYFLSQTGSVHASKICKYTKEHLRHILGCYLYIHVVANEN